MPTNTYVALDKITVSGSAVTDITFSNINQGYTDLVIVMSGFGAVADGYSVLAQVGNGSVDPNANYSTTRLSGNGSSATSGRSSNANYMRLQSVTGQSTTSSNITNLIINFMNYSNTTTFKTVLNRANQPAGSYPGTEAIVNLWRSTSAINTIKLFPFTGASFAVGSTFSLYGIRAEGVSPTTKATGGAVYSDDVYYYHVFGSSGTFTPTQSITADVLVIAGGGGGGGWLGGGGGAGGLLGFMSQSLTATGYTVTVGAGGAKSASNTSPGSVGVDSQFGALTLVKGGGAGGTYIGAGGSVPNGSTGGSGGGGGGQVSTTSSGGSATSGQGNAGGNTANNSTRGGGGGGAGAAGGASTSTATGAGGIGVSTYSSWGISTGVGENVEGVYYLAGGGSGGTNQGGTENAGGYGGGGSTRGRLSGLASSGGGGAGAQDSSVSGSGGSGVVIVRYAK